MRTLLICLIGLAAAAPCPAAPETEPQHLVWYDRAAKVWEEAIPIGNGWLGGMIHGTVDRELIKLNDVTLYSGEPGQRDLPLNIADDLARVRQWLSEGKYAEAHRHAATNWLGRAQACYQPLGDLAIEFEPSGPVADYRRQLDLGNAVVQTSYSREGIKYTREYFASYPARAIIVRLSTDKPGALNFTVRLSSVHPTAKTAAADLETLVMTGQAPGLALRRDLKLVVNKKEQWKYPELFGPDGQLKPGGKQVLYGAEINGLGTFFETRLKITRHNGQLVATPSGLRLEKASEAVLILASGSSYNGFEKSPSREGADPSAQVKAILAGVVGRSCQELLAQHLDDYRKLFNRVAINLGPAPAAAKRPTTERLANFAAGGDEAFAALYFQFGRYLMISGSRPGTQPLNLQGIWNPHVVPPWAGAYTININTEMNYWPVEVANLAECHEPLLRMIQELAVDGRKVARQLYRLPGWVAHHNTTLWRDAQPVDGDATASFWNLGSGWLCQHLWEHYLFTQDREFLRQQAYPILRSAAEFYAGWLVEDEQGRLVTPVNGSPENTFRYVDGQGRKVNAALAPGPTMDMAIIRELFTNCIQAAELLRVNEPFIAGLRQKLSRLLPHQIGARGQLMEWSRDFEEAEPKHRHVSHLYGLHPGNQITPQTPELFAACRRSLELRGDEATGWSMGWKINLWARLGDGNHAHALLAGLLSPKRTYPNLFDAHPPFQIDGNFGGCAGIAEMILQTHTGEIQLLPALPAAWAAGSIKGLRARGGFELDVYWKEGRLNRVRVLSLAGQPCAVRYGNLRAKLELAAGQARELNGNLESQ